MSEADHDIALNILAGEIARDREEIRGLKTRLQAAEVALREIARSTMRKDETGLSTICLSCGMETYHDKDGELVHEIDCRQQAALAYFATHGTEV